MVIAVVAAAVVDRSAFLRSLWLTFTVFSVDGGWACFLCASSRCYFAFLVRASDCLNCACLIEVPIAIEVRHN